MKRPIPARLSFVLILSRLSNSKEEMTNKVQLYLQAGAEEVWIVWENGIVDYYDKTGKLEQSTYGINVTIPMK